VDRFARQEECARFDFKLLTDPNAILAAQLSRQDDLAFGHDDK